MQFQRPGRPALRWPVLAALALGGIALAAQARRRDRPPLPRAPERSRSALVDGIRMRWEEHGDPDGLPVVLVHGLPTNPRLWRYVVPRIARPGIRCLAWEQVGFGRSLPEGLGRDLSIPAQARHLRSWLRHLGIDRAVFVGHDYGGGVVQQLAVTAPELFAGLVLADCVADDNWPVPAVQAARAMRPVIAGTPPALLWPLLRGAIANLAHTNRAVAAESAKLFIAPYLSPIGPKALAHQLGFFRAGFTHRIGAVLRPLDCPTIVVWGENDPLGLDSAAWLADRLGAELRVIQGAYHFTPEDEPEIIAAAIRTATDRASARRGPRTRGRNTVPLHEAAG